LYLSPGVSRILESRGGVPADGTFSIVFVKHNVRTPLAACCRSGIIAAAGKTSNERRGTFFERRVVELGDSALLFACAIVRNIKPAPKPSLAGHHWMTPTGDF
jgi:hypothetical protein